LIFTSLHLGPKAQPKRERANKGALGKALLSITKHAA
jgi:hypothetical protein